MWHDSNCGYTALLSLFAVVVVVVVGGGGGGGGGKHFIILGACNTAKSLATYI